MLNQFINRLFGIRRASAPEVVVLTREGTDPSIPPGLLPKGARVTVTSTKNMELSVSLQSDADVRGEVADAAPDSISTRDLMAICERFWSNLDEDSGATNQEAWRVFRARYSEYVRALNALGKRGPEVRDWARGLLVHHEYDARESGAWLLGDLGSKGQLGEALESVIDDLAALIDRPLEEDSKETQAIDAAIMALGMIGHPKGVPILQHVLFSTKMEHEGDTKWMAAQALEKLVGEPFMTADDPVEAARTWLLEHQDTHHG